MRTAGSKRRDDVKASWTNCGRARGRGYLGAEADARGRIAMELRIRGPRAFRIASSGGREDAGGQGVYKVGSREANWVERGTESVIRCDARGRRKRSLSRNISNRLPARRAGDRRHC